MSLHLRQEDYIAVLTVFVASLAVGLVRYVLGDIGLEMVEAAGPVILLAGGYFLYRSSRSWQKELARYLEIITLGIVMFAAAWTYQILGTAQNLLEIIGRPIIFLTGFFHPLAVGSVILISYGIFLIWKEGDDKLEFS